jgi:HEAT repeat protein
LILEDFNSPDPERQQGATRVLGALGSAAESLLVEVIKLTESRRVRQIAANLLSETGGSAGEVLKRAFAFEEMVERRVRILEVLDSVTRDVTSEFACALADKATEVREAALRLAERIGAPEIVEIVLEHARGREAEPAAMAIRCLATLKPRGAMKEVLAVLHSARDAQRVIACCQALGQFGDPSAIQALTKILTPRSSFSLRRGWNSSVRNAAALALAQLDAEEAGEALARFAKDSDPAVRRIALNARGS